MTSESANSHTPLLECYLAFWKVFGAVIDAGYTGYGVIENALYDMRLYADISEARGHRAPQVVGREMLNIKLSAVLVGLEHARYRPTDRADSYGAFLLLVGGFVRRKQPI